MAYKVVDLFAGPGGLSEGFSRATRNGKPLFNSVIAVEKDPAAHQTLTLRTLYRLARSWGDQAVLRLYWKYLSDPSPQTRERLRSTSAWKEALEEAGNRPLTLGDSGDDELIEERLQKAGLSEGTPWVLIGGPPCQAYSLVGRARMRGSDPEAFSRDRRHVLYREYLRIIRLFRPAVFVMENVKGLLSSTLSGELILRQILDDLRCGGTDRSQSLYEIRSIAVPNADPSPRDFIVRSEHYGIPQARHRVFIVGIHRDAMAHIREQRGQQSANRYLLTPSTLSENIQKTAFDAISDLEPLEPRSSSSGLTYHEDEEIRETLRKAVMIARRDQNSATALKNRTAAYVMEEALRRKERGGHKVAPADRDLANAFSTRKVLRHVGHIPNHDARSHMPSDLARYLYAAAWATANGHSPKIGDFPEALRPKHKNIPEALGTGLFADRFRVQLSGRASTTITSHIAKDGHYFIHYDASQHRSLSVREAARLQTFPDDYFFEGGRTAQYGQVGNAVPPVLAAQIAEIVALILKDA